MMSSRGTSLRGSALLLLGGILLARKTAAATAEGASALRRSLMQTAPAGSYWAIYNLTAGVPDESCNVAAGTPVSVNNCCLMATDPLVPHASALGGGMTCARVTPPTPGLVDSVFSGCVGAGIAEYGESCTGGTPPSVAADAFECGCGFSVRGSGCFRAVDPGSDQQWFVFLDGKFGCAAAAGGTDSDPPPVTTTTPPPPDDDDEFTDDRAGDGTDDDEFNDDQGNDDQGNDDQGNDDEGTDDEGPDDEGTGPTTTGTFMGSNNNTSSTFPPTSAAPTPADMDTPTPDDMTTSIMTRPPTAAEDTIGFTTTNQTGSSPVGNISAAGSALLSKMALLSSMMIATTTAALLAVLC